MAERLIAGVNVNVTDEGYLTDPSQWTREIAVEIAKELDIELTEKHWEVIQYLQKDFKATGKIPTIRRMKKDGGIDTKALYNLFPEGPLVKATKVAGLSKPASCV